MAHPFRAACCTLLLTAVGPLAACSSGSSTVSPPANVAGQPAFSGSGGGPGGATSGPTAGNSGSNTGGGNTGNGGTSSGGAGALASAGQGGAGVAGSGGNSANATAGATGAGAGGTTSVGGAPPTFSGPTVNGTVTVTRGSTLGHLSPAFAGLSFEKTHMTDNFFTADNAPLIAMCKLLGPSSLRIGANDVNISSWVANATPVAGGQTSKEIGTVEVDALADFLKATGWSVIYAVSLQSAEQPSVDEAVYASGKLGASLHSIEIGNEINNYKNNAVGSPTQQWAAFEAAIRSALPNVKLAGPAAAGDAGFVVTFADTEGKQLVLLTDHYYKGASASKPSVSDMLKIDPNVVTFSQTLAATAKTNAVVDGFRWGEMNSYSGHGAAGVSDVYASALWSIDFMLTSAEYGSSGVNFHGGGQNMDGNTCATGVNSCIEPFKYSPIDEVDSKVTAAAPLFYGMLLVSQAGVGDMFVTKASAGQLNFSAYSLALADGSINVVLVNKDATSGVNASIDTGAPVTAASGAYLQAPALSSTSGVTFAGSGVTAAGAWAPKPPYRLTTSGNGITVVVPPATAILVHAQ
jgi:hypothetical protein